MSEKGFEKMGGKLHTTNMCLINFICSWPPVMASPLEATGPRLRNAALSNTSFANAVKSGQTLQTPRKENKNNHA